MGRLLHSRARAALVCLAALAIVGSASVVAVGAFASTPSHLPFGHVDKVEQIPGGFQTGGWAIDPDTSAPIAVHVYMDGHLQVAVLANEYRPDIATRYPSLGGDHGFLVNVMAPAGTHTVCVYAINFGAGSGNPGIGCRTLTLNYSPSGAITSLVQYGSGFHVTGWARDPDTSAAVTVKVYYDGTQV
ncbi:MAG TPA: hypothetical protein VKQ07_08955, partial [Jatrophihabitantaceae bacterium]|nr:hypothetical protein [Jatrophihabitantaceae bacterium]